MEDIIQKAEEFAIKEIDKWSLPSKINFNTSNAKGEELAVKLKADIDIVKIGIRLMDIKLGESFKKGKVNEHVDSSVKATKEFLSKFDLDEEIKNKIINCVEGHHDKTKWKCKEAEICANADCYRFLLTKNWLDFFASLFERTNIFEKNLKYAESKLEEKW
jgi:hypothetical protein